MAITLTYGGLNINDGTKYALQDGFDPGEAIKTFAEYRSYSGDVAQYNVSEANLVEMLVPLKVMGSSLADLRDNIETINNLIDAGEQTLKYGESGAYMNFSCVHSPRVAFRPDSTAVLKFFTFVEMTLYREPTVVYTSS